MRDAMNKDNAKDRDSASALNDPLTDRKAYAGAGVFLPSVQPLEYSEYAVMVLGLDAYPVVAY